MYLFQTIDDRPWSPENRLSSYTNSKDNSEQFLCSDDGLKKKRTNSSGVTLFTYDEAALLLETDASNNLLARYTNSPGHAAELLLNHAHWCMIWGGLASQSRSGVSWFYGFDSQLCARILVSMAGVISDSYSYKVFGEPLQSGSGTVNPYGDIALGLYYTGVVDLINAWNRWLKASVGRWESRDPIGFDGGDWNPFAYVGNEPVGRRDPSGFVTEKELGSAIAAAEKCGFVCHQRKTGHWSCVKNGVTCGFPGPHSRPDKDRRIFRIGQKCVARNCKDDDNQGGEDACTRLTRWLAGLTDAQLALLAVLIATGAVAAGGALLLLILAALRNRQPIPAGCCDNATVDSIISELSGLLGL